MLDFYFLKKNYLNITRIECIKTSSWSKTDDNYARYFPKNKIKIFFNYLGFKLNKMFKKNKVNTEDNPKYIFKNYCNTY